MWNFRGRILEALDFWVCQSRISSAQHGVESHIAEMLASFQRTWKSGFGDRRFGGALNNPKPLNP